MVKTELPLVRTVSPENMAVVAGAPAPLRTTVPVDFRTAELSDADRDAAVQNANNNKVNMAQRRSGRMPFTSEAPESSADTSTQVAQ